MEEEIIRLVAEVCDVNPADIRREGDLVGYGLDSARAMDLVVALEDAFKLEIPDDVAIDLRTVDDVIQFVSREAKATW